jgi:hypothetical protein
VSLLNRLPNPEFSRTFLVCGAAAWVLVRVAFVLASALLVDVLGPAPLILEPPASLAVVAICSGLVVLDVRRKHERILLANLGVALGAVALIGAIPAILVEMAIALLATTIGG